VSVEDEGSILRVLNGQNNILSKSKIAGNKINSNIESIEKKGTVVTINIPTKYHNTIYISNSQQNNNEEDLNKPIQTDSIKATTGIEIQGKRRCTSPLLQTVNPSHNSSVHSLTNPLISH
jgi:hypothetical protein